MFGFGEGPGKQSRTVLDFGPPRPVFGDETAPAAPDESLQGVAKVEAWAGYEIVLERFNNRRAAYAAAMRTYREWHGAHPTIPLKLSMPVVDAKEAVERDPQRISLSRS